MGRLASAVVLACGLSLGCAKGPVATSAPAPPPDPAAVDALSRAVLARDDGSRLVEDAFDRLFSAPEVTAAGGRLLQKIQGSARLAPIFEGFQGELLSSPAFMAAVVRAAQAQPGQSPEQIAEALAARLEVALDSPELDAALDGALDALFDRPAIDGATDRLSASLVDRSGAVDTLVELVKTWLPDLEAAVGVSSGAPSFAAELDAYLDQPGRRAAISSVLGEHLAGDPRMVQAVAALVDSEGMLEHTVSLLHDVLEAPGFRADAIAVLARLIEGTSEAELRKEIERLLVRPEIEAAAARWFDGLGDLPETRGIADALGAVFRDPNVQAELHRAVIGIPRGRVVFVEWSPAATGRMNLRRRRSPGAWTWACR